MKKICWEESFHILHGRDAVLAMVTGTPEQFELVQEARDALVGAAHALPRHPDPGRARIRWCTGGSRARANEDARQQFLDGYVPQILELGLELPDPKLRRSDDGVWEYTEPDWEKLTAVVTGHGPASQERLAFRRLSRADVDWVSRVMLPEAA